MTAGAQLDAELHGGQPDSAAGAQHDELVSRLHRATDRSTWYAVRWATPKAAAEAHVDPGGDPGERGRRDDRLLREGADQRGSDDAIAHGRDRSHRPPPR